MQHSNPCQNIQQKITFLAVPQQETEDTEKAEVLIDQNIGLDRQKLDFSNPFRLALGAAPPPLAAGTVELVLRKNFLRSFVVDAWGLKVW